MKSVVWMIIVSALLAAGGCGTAAQKSDEPAEEAAAATPKSELPLDSLIQVVAGSNNTFALDLYRELSAAEGNLFFSPYSISSALAMTWAGARGKTASQMKEVLHFTLPDGDLHRSFGGLTASLNERGEAGGYELTVANALWAQRGYPFREAFLELTRTAYDAGLKNVDFAASPEPVRLEINGWVEEKTRNKIQDLLPQGSVTTDTRLVLTNAIYFKGSWAAEFDSNRTMAAPFFLSAAESIEIPMMHRVGNCDYLEEETFQAVRLPYLNNELSMVVVLPRMVDGLKELETSLSPDMLAGLRAGFLDQEIKLFLPRFKMTSQFKLREPLAALGMLDAFSPKRADFTGMSERRDLSITAVLHKAFVEVNEEGTEAAAATGIVMGVTSVAEPIPVPVFRADHPFIFFIQDNRTSSILFLGRLENPAE